MATSTAGTTAGATAAAPRPARLPVLAGVLPAAAAIALAAVSWQIAGVPVRFAAAPVWPYVVYYAGLAVLLGSWLALGRRVRRGTVGMAALRRYTLAVAVPLLAAAPFGRDLWAYAAQGHLTGTGRSPYLVGPAAAPGAFAAEVSTRWAHSPAPYGPLWLRLSQFAAWLTGSPTGAALLLRLPAFAGLLLAIWALGRLPTRHRAQALWLGAANPLLLVLGLGGGHNDVVMIGLILAAAVAATRRQLGMLAVAGALLGVAVLVKSPAALALPFTVPLWLQANGQPTTLRHLGRTCLTAAGAAAVTVVVLSAACGLGYGWTGQVGADSQWVSWLSLPTAAGMLAKLASGTTTGLRVLDGTIKAFRSAGEVLIVVATLTLWLLALRGRDAVACLALSLGLAAALAPSVQPWYFCWGIALAGLLALPRPVIGGLAATAVGFTVMITPSGAGWESDWRCPVVLAGGALVTWFALRRSTPDDDGAERTRPEMGAHHGAEFGHV